MSESRNVYQRINAVKRGLRTTSLKKTGVNTFSKYNYMNLTDFEDTLEDLCDKEGINTLFQWYPEKVILKITNVDNPSEFIEVCSPTAACGIKGATEVQNLGGMQTYLRRYLFTSTFGIAEHDALEEQAPEDKNIKKYKPEPPKAPQKPTPAKAPEPPKEKDWKETLQESNNIEPLIDSPRSKEAYVALIGHFGYHKDDRDSEQNKKALADTKAWMMETFGEIVQPMHFSEEQVEIALNFLSKQGPESFVDDNIA